MYHGISTRKEQNAIGDLYYAYTSYLDFDLTLLFLYSRPQTLYTVMIMNLLISPNEELAFDIQNDSIIQSKLLKK